MCRIIGSCRIRCDLSEKGAVFGAPVVATCAFCVGSADCREARDHHPLRLYASNVIDQLVAALDDCNVDAPGQWANVQRPP